MNPSFEGIPAAGTLNGQLPVGWNDCGFTGESVADVHPELDGGTFKVTTLPVDGSTYLGMVARENNTYERVGQKLSAPLAAGVSYTFSIWLCHSENYVSPSRASGQIVNFDKPLQLRIWGALTDCDLHQLLAVSDPVNDVTWQQYAFTFTPGQPYTHIILEAYYTSLYPEPYAGNLLLDSASALIPADSSHFSDSPQPLSDPYPKRREYARDLMGTEFRILLYSEEDAIADQAAEDAFERIAELESIMSDYREDSELSRLNLSSNGHREAVEVSEDLYKVLSFAVQVSKKSKGAFDITSGTLTKLWRRAFRQKEFPAAADIEAAKSTVDYRKLGLYKKHYVKLDKPGMRLDLGGIAKGYAIDEAMKVLKSQGISIALIDGGGDVLAADPPPMKSYWDIEIPLYKEGQKLKGKMSVANSAVVTSGDTYRYLEHEGKRYSHIIDPRTGYGVDHRMLVTIQAPTCMEADAWATALSVDLDTSIYLWLKKKEGYDVFFAQQDTP